MRKMGIILLVDMPKKKPPEGYEYE